MMGSISQIVPQNSSYLSHFAILVEWWKTFFSKFSIIRSKYLSPTSHLTNIEHLKNNKKSIFHCFFYVNCKRQFSGRNFFFSLMKRQISIFYFCLCAFALIDIEDEVIDLWVNSEFGLIFRSLHSRVSFSVYFIGFFRVSECLVMRDVEIFHVYSRVQVSTLWKIQYLVTRKYTYISKYMYLPNEKKSHGYSFIIQSLFMFSNFSHIFNYISPFQNPKSTNWFFTVCCFYRLLIVFLSARCNEKMKFFSFIDISEIRFQIIWITMFHLCLFWFWISALNASIFSACINKLKVFTEVFTQRLNFPWKRFHHRAEYKIVDHSYT